MIQKFVPTLLNNVKHLWHRLKLAFDVKPLVLRPVFSRSLPTANDDFLPGNRGPDGWPKLPRFATRGRFADSFLQEFQAPKLHGLGS